MKTRLSKSLYIQGLRCHKALWKSYWKHEKPERSASMKRSAREGNEVGELAQSLFKDGVLVKYEQDNFVRMAERTSQLIEDGATIIYEATFVNDIGLVMVDILEKTKGGWIINEVKASTRVKDQHLEDAAFQYAVVSTSLNVVDTRLVIINSEYSRLGHLLTSKMFRFESIHEYVKAKRKGTLSAIESMKNVVVGEEPLTPIGSHCTAGNNCDFKANCWKSQPKHSVFTLSRIRGSRADELQASGFTDLLELPLCLKLTDNQRRQLISVQENAPIVDKERLREFFDKLSYPLINFDIETFQEAIPSLDKQAPYQQIPFQLSIHAMEESGKVSHKEFLGDGVNDPREAFILALLDSIPKEGTVLVYNQSFEISRLKELARDFPEYSDGLSSIIDRVVDLMEPFSKGGYYHPEFKGSLSIKSVLPALIGNDSELSYKTLEEVQDGIEAQIAYLGLKSEKDLAKAVITRKNLLAYCHLDTLAMVKVIRFLMTLIMK